MNPFLIEKLDSDSLDSGSIDSSDYISPTTSSSSSPSFMGHIQGDSSSVDPAAQPYVFDPTVVNQVGAAMFCVAGTFSRDLVLIVQLVFLLVSGWKICNQSLGLYFLYTMLWGIVCWGFNMYIFYYADHSCPKIHYVDIDAIVNDKERIRRNYEENRQGFNIYAKIFWLLICVYTIIEIIFWILGIFYLVEYQSISDNGDLTCYSQCGPCNLS